jgi:TolB-like protein/DNA-binding winged helix-turn-helix (wHTH) protein/Tfp pilus assembly protein PilF
MAAQSTKIYVLGEYRLEPDKRLLSRAGEPIHLANRPFQVLLYLIENRERVVGRHELLDRFWDGKDVYYVTLSKCVGAIRKALDDHADDCRFIETRWAEGYRYVGPAEEQLVMDGRTAIEIEHTREVRVVIEEQLPEQELATAHHPSRPQTRRRFQLAALSGILTIAAALVTTLIIARSQPPADEGRPSQITSIAVLPLKNLSNDPAQEYFSDGLTESLITALSKVEGSKVISRGSVFGFKGKDIDPREVGKRLGVSTVLEGSVRSSGGSVRVEVRLVSVDDGRIIWASDAFDRSLSNIFAVQDEIARGTAEALKLKLSGERNSQLTKHYTENVEAYHAYLKGRYFLNLRTAEGFAKAFAYFQQAIEKDENYALAHAWLARGHLLSIWFVNVSPKEAVASGKQAAMRAVDLDPSLTEAHLALATAYDNDWEWDKGRDEIERAIRLDPGNAEAHHLFAYRLLIEGRADEAIYEMKQALELDPLNVVLNVDVGEILLYTRRIDEAIEALRGAAEMDPNRPNVHVNLAQAYGMKGMYAAAIDEYLKAAALEGQSAETIAALKEAYARTGIKGYWQGMLADARARAKQGYVHPFEFARIYGHLGDKDRAFEWLEKMYAERSPHIINFKVQPEFDSLRSDPRYGVLLRRVGLPG